MHVRPGPAPAPAAGIDRPWLSGMERLEEPADAGRFVTSRVLYRKLGRLLWAPPLLAVLAALAVHLTPVFRSVSTLVRHSPGPRHALAQAYVASWPGRALFTLAVVAVLELALAGLVAVVSRRYWEAHGAGDGLALEQAETLDEARALVADGGAGLIVGGSLRAELAHLDPGFFAAPGGTTELVREHRGRFGLPPVFLHHRQAAWVELETGADLHVRLLVADADLPTSTAIERLATGYPVVKGHRPVTDLRPAMVASWPRGATWPPAPDVAARQVRARRVRRLAAGAIFLAGLVDLLEAVNRPAADHLYLLRQVFPLGVVETAGALVALAGIGLTMLARGVRRGQRRSWRVSVVVLAVTLALHAVHGATTSGVVVTGLVLALLVTERDLFAAAADRRSLRSALLTLVAGAVVAVGAATGAVEVTGRLHHHVLPGWGIVVVGLTERLAGIQFIALPDPFNDWVSPSLLGVGVALSVVVLYLLTRPVVERGLSHATPRLAAARRAADLRARDIVRRHGAGSLDYFALRDDKQWFFHRDSLVAYAVYGGVCLVSPDPIGPLSERRHAWAAFRRYCDRHGWAVAVVAASEEWLPIYREAGMHHVYLGDEAVVDVQRFSLSGGAMKGLRQAVARVQRYGYTVRFLDPSRVGPTEAAELVDLMSRNRRGQAERGFSMMLGRLFDQRDTGLLLTVVSGPDGCPAALCQFVPSAAAGGYSLDLMRRDPGEHPNGLLDFALCSTIEHLRRQGQRGLSLNFAAMRSTLEGETGDGLAQRIERWVLRRMSGVFPIESLWRFNAKYGPSWLPRYLVFDGPEVVPATLVSVMRAEALTETPVVGRFLVLGGRRAPQQAEPAPATAPR
ncbi:MAG: bifunctional lysylphosphatidylglycerol flippase/synthetase MprF [Acidimicrobiales bacterium]